MISEPELTGGPEDPVPEVISDADREPRPAGSAGPAGVPGRRAWVWGLGGVVVASAAWAGGLHAYDLHRHHGPDLHGYALGESPCAGDTLKPLTRALGATEFQAVSPAVVHLGPALDQIRCTISATSAIPHTGSGRYEAFVTVDLHKKTDPRAEFDDQRDLDTTDLVPVESTEPVPGLGDEAYLVTISDQTQELKVLHGGAVFTLTLTGYNSYSVSDDTLKSLPDGTAAVTDLGVFRPALVEAMRNVMKEQRGPS